MKYGLLDSQINKVLFILLSIPEVKWERGAKGHNIPKFLEFERGQVKRKLLSD